MAIVGNNLASCISKPVQLEIWAEQLQAVQQEPDNRGYKDVPTWVSTASQRFTGAPLETILHYPDGAVRRYGCRPSDRNGFAWHPAATNCHGHARMSAGWHDGRWRPTARPRRRSRSQRPAPPSRHERPRARTDRRILVSAGRSAPAGSPGCARSLRSAVCRRPRAATRDRSPCDPISIPLSAAWHTWSAVSRALTGPGGSTHPDRPADPQARMRSR